MTRNCCYCRFFSKEIRQDGVDIGGKMIGDCRRYPPNNTAKPWPLVRDLDWCGEWRDGKENHPPPSEDLRAYVPKVMDVIS